MPERSDSERQDDLAATAESLREDAQRVVEIEERKQDLDIEDPRLDVLSNEAERLAGQIQHKSRIERHLAKSGDDEAPDPPGPSH
jgi:hypothetical protein